jgi:hypothetical protein
MPGYRKLVEAAMPGSARDLQDKVPIHPRTISRIIMTLRREGATDDPKINSACHIIKWKRSANGGAFQPVYALGPGRDAPCLLKPLTEKQVRQRYLARIKGTEKMEQIQARQRTRLQVMKMAKRGDPLVNAFFGRAAA